MAVFCSAEDVPMPGGLEGLRPMSAPESPWDDSPSIEEPGSPLTWAGILHVIMFIQVSVGSRPVGLAPSNGGLTRDRLRGV